MKIGMVGLGKMGANMSRRLIGKGHDVVGFDLGAQARAGRLLRGRNGFEPRGAGGEATCSSCGLGDGAGRQADRRPSCPSPVLRGW